MRFDVAVVGAGVVGCAVARALMRAGERRVVVLEKEPGPALHQSGRSSGVLHAGFTYAPGSRKARFSVAGQRMVTAYAQERGFAVREIGKVVVARSEAEVPVLERLRAQGGANGVRGLRILDPEALRGVEPEVRGLAALHSPESAIVDASAFVRALAADADAQGAVFRFGAPLRAATLHSGGAGWRLRTPSGDVQADRVVTCAGLQGDRVARMCGLAHRYRVVPFRGRYHRLRAGREHLVQGLVYPVPDPRFPFVGVHLTPRTDGSVLVGPDAVLALGREAYAHLLQGSAADVGSMAGFAGFWRMLGRREVRAQAAREAARALLPGGLLQEARSLVPALRPGDLQPSHSGIRAQLVDPRGRFVEDLLVAEQEGARAVHVLNAVSPGLTSAMPFAEEVARRVRALA